MSCRLRWLGHSTVVVELDGTRVVTDPVLRRRVMHLRRDTEPDPPGELDAIVLSHQHYDHLDLPSLARLGVGTPIVVPRGGGKSLRGFEEVREVVPGETVQVGALSLRVVAAKHDGRRRGVGTPTPAVGYVLEGTQSVYFAGDTGLFDEMSEIGPVDVALIPVWGWGPRLDLDHLDPVRAAEAVALVRPKIAVPIHWGTYHVIGATDHGRAPAEAFAAAALEKAPEVDVRILPIGGSLEL